MSTQFKVPLKNPKPDFEEFEKVIKGEKEAEKVHFVELFADPEIMTSIIENFWGEKAVSFSNLAEEAKSWSPEIKKDFLRQTINWWHRMGYDYVALGGPVVSGLYFPSTFRQGKDTASLSRGERTWVEEGKGVITSWQDFQEYPWPNLDKIDYSSYEFAAKNLPEGMKIMTCPHMGVLEICSEVLLGFEGMSYLLYDEPDLVEAVFNKVGGIIYDFYKNVAEIDGVGGFFQGDDMGFTTSTTFSPQILRKLVLPWHKKIAALAHQYGKMYWLHCCGNVLALMEDFIEDVKIDAFHSFQDAIIPVGEFKKRYGDRIATFGGVDMDKLCRLDERSLREYVRNILDECMPDRYALGSGNSVANYVPVKNYLIMLDEGLKWKNF